MDNGISYLYVLGVAWLVVNAVVFFWGAIEESGWAFAGFISAIVSLALISISYDAYRPAPAYKLTPGVVYCTRAQVDDTYIVENTEERRKYFVVVGDKASLPGGCFVKIGDGRLVPAEPGKPQ